MGREGSDGRLHDIRVIETEDPRVSGVECSCGRRWVAFWGQPNVELIIDRHYDKMGVRKVVLL